MDSLERAVLLVVEDDSDDRVLIQKAFAALRSPHDLQIVGDGEELLDYLHRRGVYSADEIAPRPGLILLDLNMPRKSGHEALAEIKMTPGLKHIPVVVLTTSTTKADVNKSYTLGANGYVVKPAGFRPFVELLTTLTAYWLTTAERSPDVAGG